MDNNQIKTACTRNFPVWARVALIFPAIVVFGIPFGVVALLFGLLKDTLTPSMAQDAELLLNSVVTCIAVLLAVLFFRRGIDNESFYSLGFATKNIVPKLFIAFITAFSIIGGGTAVLFYIDATQIAYTGISGLSFIFALLTFSLVAFYEELLFRGYLLANLLRKMGAFGALTISSLLFGLLHVGNSGIGVVPFINVVLAGYLLGVSYVYTRNLWYPIFLHFFWNFIQGPVLGFKVSGAATSSVFSISSGSSTLLSGGSFGFEGSVVCSLLMLIAIFFMVACYRRKGVEKS